jgi:hypothetical protein
MEKIMDVKQKREYHTVALAGFFHKSIGDIHE